MNIKIIAVFLSFSLLPIISLAECRDKNLYIVNETDQMKAARLMCETQVNSCVAQCNALSNVKEGDGWFASSPRDKCKDDCRTTECCTR
jgi:hypothetical protein